jgi:hypothetical protein
MAPFIPAIIGALTPLLGTFIKNKFPDPLEAAKAEAEMTQILWANSAALNQSAADIIKAEAASEHWLAAVWRPVLMLTFGGLIVARWLGWTTPGLSEQEYLKLWSIVELGIGGYTIGRTVEKIMPSVTDAIRRN